MIDISASAPSLEFDSSCSDLLVRMIANTGNSFCAGSGIVARASPSHEEVQFRVVVSAGSIKGRRNPPSLRTGVHRTVSG